MTHAGMKMRRGRYHFSPTKDTPPGVKWRFELDPQSLLMEAARRVDEEPMLKEFLPSQAITFVQGEKVLETEKLKENARHILEMAIAGLPLGRIIRQGRTESFVARDMLKSWCEEGYLELVMPGKDDKDDEGVRGGIKLKLSSGLRSVPLTLLALVFIGTLGWLRWTATPDAGPPPGEILRREQIRAEVATAAQLFHYRKGEWPVTLNEMVLSGQLPPSILQTMADLGWTYRVNGQGTGFTVGS
jgi:hypothetical protein